jgi:hypothetical protein
MREAQCSQSPALSKKGPKSPLPRATYRPVSPSALRPIKGEQPSTGDGTFANTIVTTVP